MYHAKYCHLAVLKPFGNASKGKFMALIALALIISAHLYPDVPFDDHCCMDHVGAGSARSRVIGD